MQQPLLSAATLLLVVPLGLAAPGSSAESGSGSASSPLLRASADPVLDALEALESQRDAKCQATANRFEDFVYGTPLSEAAREVHVEHQKRLARQLWADASTRPTAGAENALGAPAMRAASAELLEVQEGPGELRLQFASGPEIPISATRHRQYASISYSLRAILGVQQDALISGETDLLELSPEAIEALGRTLDLVALAALQLADRDARERSEPEIGAAGLGMAWSRLAPELGAMQASAEPAEPAETRRAALALLDRIADGKVAAYTAYNELDQRDPTALLVFNINRFYARRPLSRIKAERREFVGALERWLDVFSAELLAEASKRAGTTGHPLIRAADANAALQLLMPHRIDEFEDVHVFPHLPAADRVVLEAFDTDSFRDFGLHWRSLQRAAHAAPSEVLAPDPFAAEVLVEGVSNYAVLLLRVAGEVASQSPRSARLQIDDLGPAAGSIRSRALRHRRTRAPNPPETPIVSAVHPPDAAGLFFRDATAEAKLAFSHRSAPWLGQFRQKQMKTPPTFSGGGVAAEDVDGDGDMDLLFVGGGGVALLRNDGRGHLSDVTQESGLVWRRPDGSPGEARQPLIADLDNDGLQDLIVTYVNDDHRVWHNRGGGRFEDVTERAGLGGAGLVGGPATVFDFDGDGLLDLYVGYFGDYLNGGIPTFDRDNQNALPNRLFRNLGELRFADVSEGSGADDTGWTQAVSHVDFDRDGRQDLIVANDYGRNAFLRNLGNGRFENAAPALGVTKAFHSMNVGITDLNDDDFPDVYISNLATLVKDNKYTFPDVNTPLNFDLRAMAGMLIKESDMLYMSHLEDGRLAAYVPSPDVERGPTSTGWAWDAEFFDFDHDGDDDLYLVNGTNDFNVFSMVYRHQGEDGTSREYLLDHKRESNVFFLNEDGRLKNVSPRSGADFAANSRSTAYFDADGDGDLDVAVNNFHAPATLLRNDAPKAGRHWLGLRLVGDPSRGSNRDAIGARVLVTTAEGARIRREVQGGSGYLSMNPKQVHLGLGGAGSADVRIIWPNGDVQTLRGLSADRVWVVRQGSGATESAAPAATG